MDKKAMYDIGYGLYVLTAKEGEKQSGCIINTAMQVTSTPNRIAIAVNKQNHTHDMISRTKAFNLSVLGEGAGFDLIRRFGFQSAATSISSKVSASPVRPPAFPISPSTPRHASAPGSKKASISAATPSSSPPSPMARSWATKNP